jgi:hypothetical protein
MLRLLLVSLLALGACDSPRTPSDAGPTDSDAGPSDAGPPDAGPTRDPVCTGPTAPSCVDESILELALFTDPNPAEIENTADGEGWMTHVDATGGGFNPSLSYVYARFTDEGLVRVDVGDEGAFDSMEWDIAFRRFVIRLNSGVAGPSCVGAFRTPAAAEYDSLEAPADDTPYRVEEYFTDTCELVPDGSGLGSPGTALQSFWEYPGCVQMTGNIYVVRLASGRRLKLTVTAYYEPSFQQMCQDTGSVTMGGNGSGNIRLRWQFLDP